MSSGRNSDREELPLTEDNLSDDDNAAQEMDEPLELDEDPLLLAIDDLEGRVVAAVDQVKVHPGVRTSDTDTIHEELAVLLRPVLEVAAHTAPSVARTYSGAGELLLEQSVADAYERLVSDLVLPVMLEMAQSDTIPAKRGAALEFFRALYKECHKAGSWLDGSAAAATNANNAAAAAAAQQQQAGPYGPGATSAAASHHHHHGGGGGAVAVTPALRAILKRRANVRLVREGELLKYWTNANVACLVPGVFTDETSADAVAARGIIAASAALRPCLRHVAQRIKDADDRGAARIYAPCMKMVHGVLQKLFLVHGGGGGGSNNNKSSESVRAACIKFLEIVILCCSIKPQDASSRSRGGRGQSSFEGFSLDDLPTGHPFITREALESLAEYAFTTLRGMTMMGGQVKIDQNTLADMMRSGGDGSPSEQVVAILKPAALAYLEVESSVPNKNAENASDFEIDRSNVEFDFLLSQKSYALTINAMSALAMSRPIYFKESAACLARRAVNPPVHTEGATGEHLSKAVVLAVSSQLRASCLTLLRNASSITTGASGILHNALATVDMELQADKALKMATQANTLKTAGRAARNQAKIHYEWDASESSSRSTKRQRETDDDLAKMRAAKKARGLGHGIQLPTSMSDAAELILANLKHLPKKPPASSSKSRASSQAQVTLGFVIDAIMTNGVSLSQEEGRWYKREGGSAWIVDPTVDDGYQLDAKVLETLDAIKENKKMNGAQNSFLEQSKSAASAAMGRILSASSNSRSKYLSNLGNQLVARLAFTLDGVQPPTQYNPSLAMAKDSVSASGKRSSSDGATKGLEKFVESYPLVASSLALDATAIPNAGNSADADCSLSEALLNEALMQACSVDGQEPSEAQIQKYDQCLDIFVASAVRASELANEKPNDNDKKKAAARAASRLQQTIASLPRLTPTCLVLLSAMCDIEDITKRAAEASRRTSNESVSVSAAAAAHAAKVAAEKRATAALLILRDAAFQQDKREIRQSAVNCAVGIASGRLPSSPSVHDKALKLTMNVLYSKNESLADFVVQAALGDLQRASEYAISLYEEIKKANEEASKREDISMNNPMATRSDVEKQALDRMRKPSVLIMALCVRRPKMIKELFSLSCKKRADVLSKAVRGNMSKLTKAAASKHGAADIALQVAKMTGPAEAPMLLAFLENLAPSTGGALPDQDVIDVCIKIQETKLDEDGKKDPRFLIPIVSAMKRKDLVEILPQFLVADDNILLAALVRMGDRVGRQALLFREEPDEENPTLHGMTLCEQLVYLHKLDFAAVGLPQKRYLAAIKLCIEDEEVYNDRVLMAALDEMSGTYLTGRDKLPLGFMRTNIIVCGKHESLHSWMCHVLLPRLVEGKIWSDPRQWEGWMRCAHMLEKSGDPNVNSTDAIAKLPPEQLMQYRTKWAK